MSAVAHSWFMTQRHVRSFLRQPWIIAVSMLQPIIYILIFGQLFRQVANLPGFAFGSYITFLMPAIVVMTALFGGTWAGMGLIEDLDRGVLDRFLVAPTRRSAVTTGRLTYQGIQTVIQSVILVLLGLAVGASIPGGLVGIVVLIFAAVLLSAAFAALSGALALTLRRSEAVIAVSQVVALPLVFLSTGFMPKPLIPDWIDTVATFNPLNWTVVAGREALGASVDWGLVGSRIGFLVAFTGVCIAIGVRAFRSYQRSI